MRSQLICLFYSFGENLCYYPMNIRSQQGKVKRGREVSLCNRNVHIIGYFGIRLSFPCGNVMKEERQTLALSCARRGV